MSLLTTSAADASVRWGAGRRWLAGVRRVSAGTGWVAVHLLVFGAAVALARSVLPAYVPEGLTDEGMAWWAAVVAVGMGLSCPWLALSWRLGRARWGRLGSAACGVVGYGLPALLAGEAVWRLPEGLAGVGPWLWPTAAVVVPGVALVVSARERGRAVGLAAALVASPVAIWIISDERGMEVVKGFVAWMTHPGRGGSAGLVAGGVVTVGVWWVLAVTGVRWRRALLAGGLAGLASWPGYWLVLLPGLERPPTGLARIAALDHAPTEPFGPFADVGPDGVLGWRWVPSGSHWREALLFQPPGKVTGRTTVPADGRVRLFVTVPFQWADRDDLPVRVRATVTTTEGRVLGEADTAFSRLRARMETVPSWQELVLAGCGVEGDEVEVEVAAEAARACLEGSRMPVVAVAAERARPPTAARGGGPSVLFIVVDTLRADRLHCYGFPHPTSPRIDALAAEGTLFERVVSSSSWTVPSVASLFTGTYVSSHKMTAFSLRGRLQHETLAQRFGAAGVRTAAVSANELLFPGSGLAAGFDVFVGSGRIDRTGWPRAEWVTDQAIAVLRQLGGERFFLYLHYMDPHAPYDPPPGWARFGASEEGRYLGDILYCDSQIGRLLDELDALDRNRDTLVVLMSDHGEAFMEHGWRGHGRTLHREEIDVPLILRFPGRLPAGRRVGSQVRSIDVHTTICALLELPVPRHVEGETLLPLIETVGPVADREAFSELIPDRGAAPYALVSVSDGQHKLILRPADGQRLLYDVHRDPEEQADVSDREGAVAALLEGRIRRFLDERGGLAAMKRWRPSPAEMRVLRSLGYLTPHQP